MGDLLLTLRCTLLLACVYAWHTLSAALWRASAALAGLSLRCRCALCRWQDQLLTMERADV